MSAIGTATLNFGAFPGAQEASVAVTGQGSILATSKAEAFFMADDSTSDHTVNDHRNVGLFARLICGTPTAGTGFTIHARSTQKLQGTYQVRWVWAD